MIVLPLRIFFDGAVDDVDGDEVGRGPAASCGGEEVSPLYL